MNVTTRTARVYGSQDQFGPVPRAAIPGLPITIPAIPNPNDSVHIQLGPPPDMILAAKRRSRAIAIAGMEGTLGPPSDFDRVARIRELLQDETLEPTGQEANFYASIEIERQLTIDDALFREDEFVWLDPTELIRLDAELIDELAPTIDSVSLCLAAVLGMSWFETVILPDQPFIFIEGRDPLGAPHGKVFGARLQLTRPPDAAEPNRIEDLLGTVARQPALPNWLASVGHWTISASVEGDPVKRFMWAFIGLEILSHQLGKHHHPRMAAQLALGGTPLPANASDVLIRSVRDAPLLVHFVSMAAALSPNTLEADVEEFRALKSARDDLAHGRYSQGDPLPTSRVESLIRRFVELEIRRLS